MRKLGIIGGSGLYELEGLRNVTTRTVETPFGAPSDAYVCGTLGGRELVFLPRHGRGHRLLPSEIPHKANICGFKMLGVDCVVSISAVGSLREELRPRDIVLPDQYYDRTKGSLDHTYFGGGVVAHIQFGEPTCTGLRQLLAGLIRGLLEEEKASGLRLADRGTYVNMEGPAFSTKAESNAYRQLGFDVIGMTSLPEAKLCREAELCYQAVAMVTDYDCWRETEESVTVEMIIGHLKANVALAKKIIAAVAGRLPEGGECVCRNSLRSALLSDLAQIPPATREKLRPIIGRYLSA